MLHLQSQKQERHFEAHVLLACLIEHTEKYEEWSYLSKWLAKKSFGRFQNDVSSFQLQHHTLLEEAIKRKETYVNQPCQSQDEWQLSHLRSHKHVMHEWSTSGICTRSDKHTWGLRWISCQVSKAVRSWSSRGFDWDVVEYINRHTHTRLPLIPGRSMLACSWIPIPLRMIRREPSLNAPEHVTSWEKKTKWLFPHLSSN